MAVERPEPWLIHFFSAARRRLNRSLTVEESAFELAGGRMVFGPPKTQRGAGSSQCRPNWWEPSSSTSETTSALAVTRSCSPVPRASPSAATSSAPSG